MSLLSLRWRNLWASAHFIHIDYQDFKDEKKPGCVDDEKLKEFGDHLLLLRDDAVCLDEARIFVTPGCKRNSFVWISHAIKHKVRLLHVSGSNSSPYVDSTAWFPSQHLKIIRLQSLFLSHGFFDLLNYEWPVLEHLELESCSLIRVKEISSRSLKVLHMIRCFNGEGLLICARSLTYLVILDPVCLGAIVTRDLSSLVKASVILSSTQFNLPIDTVVYGHRLLDGLSHATTLELHAPLHELALGRGLQTCPMFNNLTRLVLGDWCTAADLYPLLRILQRSSKLKELNLKLKMEECSICKDSEFSLLSSRATLSGTRSNPSIERIKIICVKEDPRVDTLVRALLPIMNTDGKISIERC